MEKENNYKKQNYVLFSKEYIINHVLIGSINDSNVKREHPEWPSQMVREIRKAGYPFPDFTDDVFNGVEGGVNSFIYVFVMERNNPEIKNLLIMKSEFLKEERYRFDLLISSLYKSSGKHFALKITFMTHKGWLFIHRIWGTIQLNDNEWPGHIPFLFYQTTISWGSGLPSLIKDKEGYDVRFVDGNGHNESKLYLSSLEDTVLHKAKAVAIAKHSKDYDHIPVNYSKIWNPGNLTIARDYIWLLHFTAHDELD